ncbi:MAG TPA: hypothetical protein VHJ20_08105 [Polyangia bacterium]|nr:hypothetical protein [Polyangia bacterium]
MAGRASVVAVALALALSGCGGRPVVGLPKVTLERPSEGADGGLDGSSDGAADGAADADASDGGDAPVEAPPPLELAASLVAKIALPGAPITAAYNGGTQKTYVACRAAADAGAVGPIAVVDDATNAVVKTIAPSAAVTALTTDGATKRVYAAEGDQVEVVDSTADMILATVKTPDGAVLAGVAADEAHDKIFAVGTKDFATNLYVLDGATNVMTVLRAVLLTPRGAPAIAVDGMNDVFVLGVDSNSSGLVVTFDETSGTPTHISTSDSMVSASASGVVSMGDGSASILFLGPGLVKRISLGDTQLPTAFTPTGVAGGDFGRGPMPVVVGFDDHGGASGYAVDTGAFTLSPFTLAFASAFGLTVPAEVVTGAPRANGVELYVFEQALPPSTSSAPAEAVKIAVTAQ